MLNDKVLPFFEAHGVRLLRILTDAVREYCGNLQQHEYELYQARLNIDHSKTKAKSSQTNGICERFHRIILKELQADVDQWIESYNTERTHSGKYCYGKTPMQTFLDAKPLADAKMIEKVYSGREPSTAPSPAVRRLLTVRSSFSYYIIHSVFVITTVVGCWRHLSAWAIKRPSDTNAFNLVLTFHCCAAHAHDSRCLPTPSSLEDLFCGPYVRPNKHSMEFG